MHIHWQPQESRRKAIVSFKGTLSLSSDFSIEIIYENPMEVIELILKLKPRKTTVQPKNDRLLRKNFLIMPQIVEDSGDIEVFVAELDCWTSGLPL